MPCANLVKLWNNSLREETFSYIAIAVLNKRLLRMDTRLCLHTPELGKQMPRTTVKCWKCPKWYCSVASPCWSLWWVGSIRNELNPLYHENQKKQT